MLHKTPYLKHRQHGQAMVEYAILLILMVTLIMGGLELSVTAYHSKKTGDAAEAGANSWAEAISYSTKSNQDNKNNQELLELYRESLNIDTDTDLATRNEDGSLVSAASCNVLPYDTCPSESLASSIRPLLDGHCANVDVYDNFDVDLPIDITGCDSTNPFQTEGLISLLAYLGYDADYPSNPQQDFSEVCTSSDNNENIEKIIDCRLTVNKYGARGVLDIYDANAITQTTCISGSPPCPDGLDDDNILDTTDNFDEDASGNLNENDNEGGATQVSCDNGAPSCPDGVIDRQGTRLDYYSSRGDINGDGVIESTTDNFDQNIRGEIENGNENALNQTSCDDGSSSCPDGIIDVRGAKEANGLIDNPDNVIDDLDPTFRRLLIRKDLAGGSSAQPIQNGIVKRIGLGNHNPLNFARPLCNPLHPTIPSNNDYNNGLPDTTSIYLFNPLPIDISNCDGTDQHRLNRSRMSILRDGYQDPAPNATTNALNNPAGDQSVEGLLQANLAMYSQYVKVCVVENAGQISIATATGPSGGTTLVGLENCSGNGRAIWLKPPGKMCGAAGGGEICPDATGNPVDLNGATGFYFFGVGNTSGRGQFTWTNNSTNTLADIADTFRPTFQIVCGDLNNNAHQSGEIDPDGDCAASGTGSFALEVHTRYRSIFESFLTFGLQALSTSPINLANYFYNPTGVGADSTVLVGATGSELGAMTNFDHDNNTATPEVLVPTVKQFKDFRGCYRVDISPPDKIGEQVKTAVSSCN